MGPILEGLLKLQRIENRLRAVKTKLARSRRSVLFQENQLRTLQSALEAKQEEIKMTRLQADRLELELKERDAAIAKLRSQLNLARTNKEYSAILTELNTAKADVVKLENQILELMKNLETDQAACDEIQKQIEEQKAHVEQVRAEAERKAAEYQKEIDAIQAEWDEAARQIPKEVLDLFVRVAETYEGEAMAAIEQSDENSSYSCGGCFMGLPAEMVNVLTTKDELLRCPNCTRILYLKDIGFE
ncbi:MAG TPA: C4-type zinc ribbon domain-containing protein [Anaerohalosphaeraceae bacterium]|nr:C4-type zinc ribbon domain-containing protein [Anaerohalosphaeraceae bacterium]HPB92607.1 C4-type zinc ribbon domain-containing protein [Anaerohalosphaeraceae bacterium]